jgi:ribosome-interacting GTPase 1
LWAHHSVNQGNIIMSIISATHHKVVPFTKESKAFESNVLLRIIAKGASRETLGESKCVSAPIITDAEIMQSVDKFMPVLRAAVHDARQQLARIEILAGKTELSTESISLQAAIKYLTDESSGRLTTQVMQEWFVENYAEAAISYVCEAVKFDAAALSAEQEKAVNQRVNVIRDCFAGFASPKYAPSIKVCNGILAFCKYVSDVADARMNALHDKVTALRDKQIAEMNEALFDMPVLSAQSAKEAPL